MLLGIFTCNLRVVGFFLHLIKNFFLWVHVAVMRHQNDCSKREWPNSWHEKHANSFISVGLINNINDLTVWYNVLKHVICVTTICGTSPTPSNCLLAVFSLVFFAVCYCLCIFYLQVYQSTSVPPYFCCTRYQVQWAGKYVHLLCHKQKSSLPRSKPGGFTFCVPTELQYSSIWGRIFVMFDLIFP